MRSTLRAAVVVFLLAAASRAEPAAPTADKPLSPVAGQAVPRLRSTSRPSFVALDASLSQADERARKEGKSPLDEAKQDAAVSKAAAAAAADADDKAVPSDAREDLSSVMNRLGRHQDAERLSNRTLETEPDNRDALNNRAMARYSLGEYRLAIDDATRAMRLDPTDQTAYTTRALSHYYGGDYLKAADDARRALALDKNNEVALATLRMAESRIPPSQLQLDPAQADQARRIEQEYQAQTEERNEVEADAASPAPAASAAPASDLERDAAAKIGLNDPWAAIDAASKAIDRDPSSARAWTLRASAYNLAGQREKAAADAARALQLAPGEALAYDARAQALLALGRADAAVADETESIALKPTNGYAFATRARAYEKLGDYPAMLSDFQRAASLNPEFESAYRRAAAEHAAAPAQAAPEAPPTRPVHPLWIVGVFSVAGGLLIALGLVHIVGASSRRAAAAARPAEPESPALLPHFEIVRVIGRGGMGVVYEAVDKGLGRRVALKKMRDEIRLEPRERERFLQEARTIAALHHPCIVDIHAIVEEAGELCLVFEYVSGRTVEQLIAEKRQLSLPETRHLVRGVCRALDYAHQHGVVHRDLKPSNVMLSDEREVKVMDFGVARHVKDALYRAQTAVPRGTPQYMAPEVEEGVVRPESDLFSLGVILYELLTGQRPFRAPAASAARAGRTYVPASRVRPEVPPELDALIDAALEPDPDRRVSSAAGFLGRFETAVSSLR